MTYRRLFIVLFGLMAIVLAGSQPQAKPWHGGASSSGCLFPSYVNLDGQNDGCGGSNPNALFIDRNFFNEIRQSGQSPYAINHNYDIAGVDYPIGIITAISSHRDIVNLPTDFSFCQPQGAPYQPNFVNCNLTVATLPVNITGTSLTVISGNTSGLAAGQQISYYCSGCNHPTLVSGSGNNWTLSDSFRRNGTPTNLSGATIEFDYSMDMEHYSNTDGALTFTGGSGAVTVNDFYSTWTQGICAFFNGNGMVTWNGVDPTLTNSEFTMGSGCSLAANLYGTSYDPGFPALSNFTGTVTNGVVTMSAATQLPLYAGSFIKFPGNGTQRLIYFTSGDASCASLSACQAETINLSASNCTYATGGFGPGACSKDTTANSSAGVAISAGPVLRNSEPFATGGGENLHYAYNVLLDMGNMRQGNGDGNIYFRYSYLRTAGGPGAHVDGFAQQPTNPGCQGQGGTPPPPICSSSYATTIESTDESFNIVATPNYSASGTYTGLLALFTTSGVANVVSPYGYTITRDVLTTNNDVLITNKSCLQYGNTSFSCPNLSAANVLIGLVGQGSVGTNPQFVATWTADGANNSILHVSSIVSGSVQVGQWINCNQQNFHPNCIISQVQSQLTTQGSDLSTWLMGPNSFTDASSDTVTVVPYPPIVNTWNIRNIQGDPTASNGCFAVDPVTTRGPTTINATGSTNLLTGSTIDFSHCH